MVCPNFLIQPIHLSMISMFIDSFESITEPFDPQRIAYRQRVRKSAQTLVAPNEAIPASLDVCWHCIARGQLNEALNEITIQGLSERSAYDEVIKQLDGPKTQKTPSVSERKLLEMEETIRHELLMAEMLDVEYNEVEAQLKTAIDQNSKTMKSVLTLKNAVSMARDAIDSVEVKIVDLNYQIEAVPKSPFALWDEFFKIEDHLTFASIRNIPLAYQAAPTGLNSSLTASSSWNAASQDAQNIASSMILISSLVGRLTNTLPPPLSEFIRDRPYRILTTPTVVETRSATPRINYPLIPFINDKFQENWYKAIKILADSVALIYRHWKQPPPHPLPDTSEETYYILDLAKPNQWNEKMRYLLLNIKNLIVLRFPTPHSAT
jgi:hypothetical protein